MEPPPLSETSGLPDADLEHLRQLTLFHYIYCGLQTAFMFFGLSFFGFGLAMATHPDLFQGAEPPPLLMSVLFQSIGMFFVVVTAASAIVSYLAGKFIKQRKHYVFCIVIACINCLNIPLGTALGVFTIVVLSRTEVKELFGKPN